MLDPRGEDQRKIQLSNLLQLCNYVAATCHPTDNINGQSDLGLRSTSGMNFVFSTEIQNMNLKPELYLMDFSRQKFRLSISYKIFEPSIVNGMLAQPALAGCLVGA